MGPLGQEVKSPLRWLLPRFMPRTRVAAATTLSVALLWALVMLMTAKREPPVLNVITDVPETTTTQPDFEALVQSGAVGTELSAEEEELTEAVLATTTTSTATSTTTTLPTQPKKSSSSPKTTSPPTTSPPATSPPATIAAGFVSSAESDFAGQINSYRSSNGKPNLSRNGSLNSYARSWAKHMAQNGSLSHSNIGALLSSWSAAAENVGSGGSVSGIFDALVSSSGHRSNMVGDYTHFGVGVYRDSSGRLWTAHVFTR